MSMGIEHNERKKIKIDFQNDDHHFEKIFHKIQIK